MSEPEPSDPDRLADRLAAVSPLWAAALAPAPPSVGSADPRAGIEAIREGWLLHRGASRLAPGCDDDQALLMGDWCYAAGLCDVAESGTLDDVAALAQLVAELSMRSADGVAELDQFWGAGA